MIAYLHGFNSQFTPDSDKMIALSKLGELVGVNYDSFANREDIIQHICESLREYADRVTIIGTSLGGYYAAAAAKILGTPCVVINPCVCPFSYFNGLDKDSPYTNYHNSETRFISQSMIDSYCGHQLDDCDYSYTPLLLLADDDAVFDSDKTANLLREFLVARFPSGGHAFSNLDHALDAVREYVDQCSLVSHLDF